MTLVRQVAYLSRIADDMTPAAERRLMSHAERNNRRAAITGVLITSGRYYLQVLEGPDEAIAALLPKVRADPRHFEVRVLFDRQVRLRSYPRWSMGYLYSLDLADELAALHSGGHQLAAEEIVARFRPDPLGSAVFGRASWFREFEPPIG